MNTPSPHFEMSDFRSNLLDHSNNPPGKDPVLKAFYGFLLANFEKKSLFYNLIETVKTKRPQITSIHLINLLFRAYQFIKFEEKDLCYRNFTKIDQWKKELIPLLSNNDSYKVYLDLLLTKSTNTSIYQRYSGPFAIMKYLNQSSPVSILDVGCGGNYGLRGFEVQSFSPFKDHTPGEFITKSFKKKLTIKQAIAVDRENPDDIDVYEWRLACSFYPQELDQLERIIQFEGKIRQSRQVTFIKTDFLQHNSDVKFDAIIFCVMLYQHDKETRDVFFDKARSLLKPDGVIIVQDFAKKDTLHLDQLDFNASWFGQKFAHKTFILSSLTNWEFWEIFKWNNGRCQEAETGEDFARFLELKKSNKISFSIEQVGRSIYQFFLR